MARDNPRDDRLMFLAALIAVLTCWEFLVRSRNISPASFAAPTEIVPAIFRLFRDKGFGHDVAQTCIRACLGTLFGYPLGILVPVGMHRLGRSQTFAECLLDLVRSIPITALIPIFIAIYGVGDANKIAVGAFSSFLVTAITVWIALKHGMHEKAILLALYRPSYWKTIRFVLMPQILPALVTAARLSVSSSLVLVIVAEMFIGTTYGIGRVINDMTYTDDRAAQYAAVLCAGLLGYALNVMGSWIHARLSRQTGATPPPQTEL